MSEEWEQWIARTTGNASARAIAQRIGRSHTTVRRWIRNGIPPEAVIAIAIAYEADVMVALVTAGWIDESDIARINIDDTLKQIQTVKLTGELHRRAVAKYRQEHRRNP